VLLHCFAGCSVEEIVRALGLDISDLFEHSPATDKTPKPKPISIDNQFSDRNNALILAKLLRDHAKYVPQWGWLLWDSVRWKRDVGGYAVLALAREKLPEHYLKKALEAIDHDARKVLTEYVAKAHSKTKIEAALELCKGDLLAQPEVFDIDPYLLCVQNGIVDLQKQAVLPHMRELDITLACPVKYNPGAKAPTFEKFLREIFLDNEELIAYVKRALGYSITGDTSENKVFICYGTGANGKSTLLQAIRSVLGDYAVSIPPEALVRKRYDVHPTALAHLMGRRFAIASETDEMSYLNESRVKVLAGRDTITARFMHKDYFDFEIEAKVWLATNHKPIIKDTSEAMWRRISLIPFNAFFPPEQQDKHLLEKLKLEAEGILTWLVEGCYEWLERGLDEPEIVKNAVASYRSEMDILQEWLEERCAPDPQARTLLKTLYADYGKFCEDIGVTPISSRAFSAKLDEKGFQTVIGTGNARYKKGIAIRSDQERPGRFIR
jgi:putative DNA primase/helicase